MLNIALFGPPGSGKGTQSKYLLEKYHLDYISMGDILREQIAQATTLGKQAKALIDKGQLVPDELVVKLLEDKLYNTQQSNGFLFDGFPRTLKQAQILDNSLTKIQTSLSCMICLEVPEEELTRRLLERATIQGRSDDTQEVIEARFKEYESKTKPVIDYYQKAGLYFPILGTGSLQEVFERISQKIDSI